MSGGRFSRQKGIRNELKLRDEFRKLGYESLRIPLSGAQAGYKGDVKFCKDGKTLIAECKARKCSFTKLYSYLAQMGTPSLAGKEKVLPLILDVDGSRLCVYSQDLKSVLEYNGSYWAKPTLKDFQAMVRKLTNLRKLVGDCDILAVKDDRKPFLFIRYL